MERVIGFLRTFYKVGPTHIVQYATHISAHLFFSLQEGDEVRLCSPPTSPNSSCTAECRAQFTQKKSCLFHYQQFCKVYIHIFVHTHLLL